MNKSLFKELLKGLRWVILALIILAGGINVWYWIAWLFGWYVHKFFDLKNFGPWNYVQFGSCVLVFTLVIQIITVILTGWFLISWGKSRKMKEFKGAQEKNG